MASQPPKYFSCGCLTESELLEDSPIFLGCMDLDKLSDRGTSAKIEALEDSLQRAIEKNEALIREKLLAIEITDMDSAKIKTLEDDLKRAIEEKEKSTKERLLVIDDTEMELHRMKEDKELEIRGSLLVIREGLLAKQMMITELDSLIIESLTSHQNFEQENLKWTSQAETLAAPIETISRDSDSAQEGDNATDKISRLLEKSNKLKLERKQKLDAANWAALSKTNLDEVLRLRKDLGGIYEVIIKMRTLLKSYDN